MIKVNRANRICFYAMILVWFIFASVVFNYTVINAQNRINETDAMSYVALFRDVIIRLKTFYVEELTYKDLIEFAIDGLYAKVTNDTTGTRDHFSFGDTGSPNDFHLYISLFNQELIKVRSEYGENYTIKDLIESSIEGMLSTVDPYTNFYRPDELESFRSQTEGEFGGLGISIDRQGDYVVVVSPMEGTPAYKMGILAGDKIVSVDHVSVVGMKTEDVISKMRGPKGSRVLIGIERYGVSEVLEFDIVRDIIKIKSIPYVFKTDNGVGYLRINTFSQSTSQELREAIDSLESEGIKGLIVDLRNNGGGLLNEAVETVNEFIGPGKLVVSTKGRMPQSSYELFTRSPRMRSGYPVVVLINEASASASEIFAGSLQDWDRALILGKTSFGKGSVQQIIPLSFDYGLKVTISKYYIKSGRCIHKDINDKLFRGKRVTDEEREAIQKEIETHQYYTVNGREVTGGGGITPDITIEGTYMTKFEREIRRMNLFFEYTFDYYREHADEIIENFYPSESMLNEFLEFGASKGLVWEKTDIDSSLVFIERSLARDVISKKFGDIAGFKVAIPMDTQLVQAIELFDRFSTLESLFEYSNEVKQLQ